MLNVIGMLTPGPDLFLVMRIAMRSRKHALATVLGVSTGLIVWVTLTVFGAAALLYAYPALLGVIQFVGGLWLIWMGRGMLLSARNQFRDRHNPIINASLLLGTPRDSYRNGLITNLSNPKVVLYFSAIIAPLMPTNPSVVTAVTIVISIVASTMIGFSALVYLLSIQVMQQKFLKAGPFIDLAAGLFFVAAGASLAITGGDDLIQGAFK